MSDEIGSVRMGGEEILVMPEIPVRPNNAIPVVIGILLILGSMIGGLLALGSGAVYLIDDQMRADGGFTEEQNRTFDMMKETGMAGTFTILYGAMSLGLMVAGIMLMRKNPLGVKVGMAAGSLFFIGNIIETVWLQFVAGDYGFEATVGSGLIIEFACGAFCIALPLVAVLIPEGRAAMYREPMNLETTNLRIVEEE
ncbi:MAG: hypothetical protein QGF94_05540 [Candidatus Thalassarchaeaceae archaeon]|jgi:hypothetical protein|nr:hypothetical protein [Candidatus Thalassarchaeaceae archaeon]